MLLLALLSWTMHAIAHWWDTVELWLTSLPYVPQVLIVLIALVMIAMLIVRVLVVVIDQIADVIHPGGGDDALAAAPRAAGDSPGEGT